MMAEYIPNVTGEEAGRLVKNIYSDANVTRLPLDRVDRFKPSAPRAAKLWIDSGFDGFDDAESRKKKPDDPWFQLMRDLPNFDELTGGAYLNKPVQPEIDRIVEKLLDRCASCGASWITVPQMPITNGSERNKLNRALAKAAGKWKSASRFSGRLILPLVFLNQRSVNNKTDRNPKVQQADKCYHDAQADGFWVVDQSLDDESGSGTLRNKRFPGLLALHQELNERIPSKLRIGGPYWGLNLLLWARDLIDFPMIGIGTGYGLFLSGGTARQPSARIAISSLRRRVKVTPALDTWLNAAIKKLGTSHPACSELVDLRRNLTILSDTTRAREQVAVAYKQWFDEIASHPAAGRSMALFQDLSAAYALGKSLPPIAEEGGARRPEAVAEPLMLSCL